MIRKVELSIIDELISNREMFDSFVYTPLDEAMSELKKRSHDDSIKLPENFLIPDSIKLGNKAFLYVCVITPNYQIRRYVQLAEMVGLEPLIFEQKKDKFTSNNEWKHALGKLRIYLGRDKNKKSRIEFLNILDFNISNGKPIDSLNLKNNISLVDFHHEFFFKTFPHLNEKINIFDGSDWLRNNGKTPVEYYRAFLSLLIKHGIQFENFMLDEKEVFFTKEIFLPAFIHVYNETGKKPLIVALEPTETEGDEFWVSYPTEDKEFILSKLKQ